MVKGQKKIVLTVVNFTLFGTTEGIRTPAYTVRKHFIITPGCYFTIIVVIRKYYGQRFGNAVKIYGPLGGIRTPDPADRNRIFYPTELRADV